MPALDRPVVKPRPVYLDLFAIRQPLAAVVSILHRISGALLFVLLPFLVWLLDVSLTSEISYERFTNAFIAGVGFVPAFLIKLVVFALIWAYLHHFIAGVRHLWMDATHSVSQSQGHLSALITLGSSLLLTLVLGAKLFGLY